MAYAARFHSLIFWVLSLLGSAAWAEEKAVSGSPVASTPAVVAPADSKGFDSGGTVSLLGYVLTIVVLGAAGVTVLLRGGFFGVSWGAPKAPRKLNIEESRTVGSRQHLAVVEYEGRRVLLGISPNRIDFLCGLENHDSVPGATFSEALSDATSRSSPAPKADQTDVGTKEVL